ncbi:MAG TPA: hypothetical protein VLT32_22960 [Candidatus Sulfomarinibacteraceae bacterium]|nr:hypothetical protein [Candidatus Sulfomarinibacteraceae bacterium]
MDDPEELADDRRRRRRGRLGLWALLAVAAATYATAVWAERRQEHSYLWTVRGDRFVLTAFMVPWHHHGRDIPWQGIDRISAETDHERPELRILVLHYGFVEFRMPSQSSETIAAFDRYVARLQELLDAARGGEASARMLYVDPLGALAGAAGAASAAAWVALFVALARRSRRGEAPVGGSPGRRWGP